MLRPDEARQFGLLVEGRFHYKGPVSVSRGNQTRTIEAYTTRYGKRRTLFQPTTATDEAILRQPWATEAAQLTV